MSEKNRPFINKSIEFFLDFERNNWYSLGDLQQLQYELKFRNTNTYPRYGALNHRVQKRLVDLNELYELLSESFNDAYFYEWFFGDGVKKPIFESAVTTGSQPVDETEFDLFLRRHEITPSALGSDLEILIVGRNSWNSEELTAQVKLRIGRHLKVYSQEMAIAFLGCGKDPFDDENILSYFGKGHPALEFFMNMGFDWPTTNATTGTGILQEVEWPKVGLLSHMGYKVGIKGLRPAKRRQILERVFHLQPLPLLNSQDYLDQWGQPSSALRLQKIADCIASFVRTRKRNDPEKFSSAIDDWESDLAWLENTIYKNGHFTFKWPSTFVGGESYKTTSDIPLTYLDL